MNNKFDKIDFVKKINKISPSTLFHWWYLDKHNSLQGSKHRNYNNIDKFSFLKKKRFLRTKIFSNNFDELILDFDNKNLNQNIRDMKKAINKLNELKITKFETFLSGGKGTHLHLRYDFSSFMECGGNDIRRKVRELFFKNLRINVNVDNALFRTNQMIGLEGFNHRKTNKPKLRIKISLGNYEILEEQLNFRYLTDEYINKIPSNIVNQIKSELNKNKKSIQFEKSVNLNNIPNYEKDMFLWHIKRFEEIYQNIKDGKKRLFDSLTRFLLSRTHNLTLTKEIITRFQLKYNIQCSNLDERIKYSKIAYEKHHALFPYHDIISKVEFYKGWPWAIRNNEPFKSKKMSENKKPIKIYKTGLIKLSVWKNETPSGDIVHSLTFQKSFLDKNNEWQNTTNLNFNDLPPLKVLIDEAYKDGVLKFEVEG